MSHGPVDQTLLGYYIFRLAGVILPRIPARLAYPLAAHVGDLYYWLLPQRRSAVADNISHVLGESPQSKVVRKAVREVCRNLALNFYDMFRVPNLTDAEIEECVEVIGWEHVSAARKAGRGIILVTLHFGNLDLVMQVLALRALPVTIPAEHLKPERLFQYVWSLRTSHGMLRVVPVDGPLLGIMRALRRNEATALAVDRDVTGSGRRVDFFGAPARLPDGPVRLALRTGAQILAGFGIRRPGGRFRVSFYPVPLSREGDDDASVARGMAALVSVLEQQIRADPGQWFLTAPLWDQRRDANRSKDENRLDLPL